VSLSLELGQGQAGTVQAQVKVRVRVRPAAAHVLERAYLLKLAVCVEISRHLAACAPVMLGHPTNQKDSRAKISFIQQICGKRAGPYFGCKSCAFGRTILLQNSLRA
jgi:hypothetical protein